MNEQRLFKVIAELGNLTGFCLQSCGLVRECEINCEKCFKNYLTAETETTTEVEKEEPRKELYTTLLEFINEWNVQFVCVYADCKLHNYCIELESGCEELAERLTDLAYNFNGNDCCLFILKNFENTPASLIDMFAEICSIYWRD